MGKIADFFMRVAQATLPAQPPAPTTAAPAMSKVGAPDGWKPSLGLLAAMVALKPRARETVQFFLDRGCPLHEACGWAAQAHGESSFIAHITGDKRDGVATAFGMFQMHPVRCDAIKAGCGVDMRALPPMEDQLRGVWWELQHTEHAAFKKVQATANAYDAGFVACKYFERPANQAVDCPKRGGYAQAWYDLFKSEGLTAKKGA